jgi:hypothetical protein
LLAQPLVAARGTHVAQARGMIRRLALLAALGLAACGGTLQWHHGCGGCGIAFTPPDGGWGPGTCGSAMLGDVCTTSGQSCTFTANPCDPGLTCAVADPDCGPPRP